MRLHIGQAFNSLKLMDYLEEEEEFINQSIDQRYRQTLASNQKNLIRPKNRPSGLKISPALEVADRRLVA